MAEASLAVLQILVRIALLISLISLFLMLLGVASLVLPRWLRRDGSSFDRLSKLTPKVVEIFLLAIAATAGLYATQIYKETNSLSMLVALEQRDRDARGLYVVANNSSASDPKISEQAAAMWQGKDLMKIFADEPDVKVDNDSQCTPAIRQAIRKWAVNYFDRAAKVNLEWRDIDELYNHIWSSESMLDEHYVLSRVLVMHAIDYLYIVHDAVRAKQNGYFTEDEYAMWRAYIDDLGPSPFFLLAIKDGIVYGYMMPEVVREFRGHIARQPKLRCIVSTEYPRFWTEKIRDHAAMHD